MFLKLNERAAPAICLALSGLWMLATILPLCYSLLFPNEDIRHVVRAFEGRERLEGGLASLASVTDAVGQLKRAISVAAYWAAEYKGGASHATKTRKAFYLAWFEKRSRPTLLIITRTETDGSDVRLDVTEGSPLALLRDYLVPALALAFSAFWFVKKRSSKTPGL
jgi:hypothetical protein